MKRHKRGKAQISYLNTRGKSKAGSRIRLANTVAFFEEINERLQDWICHGYSDRKFVPFPACGVSCIF
ncbi:MAG: hypothetical protein AAFV07_16855 [Bacteroidota bacterium]